MEGGEESFVVVVWLKSKAAAELSTVAQRLGDFKNLSGMAGTCFPSLNTQQKTIAGSAALGIYGQQVMSPRTPKVTSPGKHHLGTVGPLRWAVPGHQCAE